jgi:hypothetical protein
MATEGWIFIVAFRLLDVGLLVFFLIWFFRLRDDGDDADDEGPGGGGGGPAPSGGGPGGGGLRVALRSVRSGPRVRDHVRPRRPLRRRGAESPVPRPLPGRVRRPAMPTPAHKRA